jgi:putative transposase
MPRTARAIEANMIYHVLNRGTGRMRIFRKPGDYEAFERVLAEGLVRYPVELLTYCLMPNHWHLVARPRTDKALGRWLGWVGVTHVRRYHEHYHSRGGGHLYQGRFKSFPVTEDEYFLVLCRYVEANAVRAGLVERAEQWQWSGLWRRVRGSTDLPLSPWPLTRSRNWLARVNRGLNDEQLDGIRTSVNRGRPFGPEPWVQWTAKRLGLDFTLRGPGRPRITPNNQNNQ